MTELQNCNIKVLIVEDEPKIAKIIMEYLEANNMATHWVNDGTLAMDAFIKVQPALILLDVMLPGVDGFSLCKNIRQISAVPIVMLTARVEEKDRLEGFDLGIDDYICKPFSPRELVYRVKAILNRVQTLDVEQQKQKESQQKTHSFVMDVTTYTAHYMGVPLDLTSVEFKLLATFIDSKDRIFTRDDLLDRIYSGHREVNDRAIDSHIKNLRKKLKAVNPANNIIHSVYGIGYKFQGNLA